MEHFRNILEQWESTESRKAGRSGKQQEQVKTGTSFGDMVDKYPPQFEEQHRDSEQTTESGFRGRKALNKMKPEDELDLHGCTVSEAEPLIRAKIQSMYRQGKRKGLIIHGKGNNSPNGSVLRPLTRRILESSRLVGNFDKSKSNSGVTWFIVRKK